MFKKRLRTFLIYLIGIPTGMVTIFTLMYWMDKWFPCNMQCYKNTQYYIGWILGFIMGFAAVFALYKFINWLCIEPYKEWKKNKQNGENL
jgi:hypothetical protein